MQYQLTLILIFVLLPVSQVFSWSQQKRDRLAWRDVFWLVVYFGVGFTVLYHTRHIFILSQ